MTAKAEKVIQIMSDTLGIEPAQLKLDADLKKDLQVDSLDRVELIMELENNFGIAIPDSMIERLKTPKHLIDYIEMARPLPIERPLMGQAA